jgi:hypothetical protein
MKRTALALLLAAVTLLFVACDEVAQFDILADGLPDGRVGEEYAGYVHTANSSGDVEIYLLDGQLPPGVAFRQYGDYAKLYGTPTLAGQYLFTVEAVDYHGEPGSEEYVSRGFVLTVLP